VNLLDVVLFGGILTTRARKRGADCNASLTRRVTIAWHERPAREFMGETPIPRSKIHGRDAHTTFEYPVSQSIKATSRHASGYQIKASRANGDLADLRCGAFLDAVGC